MSDLLKSYLKNISAKTSGGDAREESYYPVLEKFLEEFGKSIDKAKTHVTTLPKKTEAGNPDFRVWDGKQHIVGYIEAKVPGEILDRIETSEQLKRYRGTFPNLILTNFYEFRLYRNGELIDKAQIARSFISKKLQTTPPLENEEQFTSLLEKFFAFSLPKVFTAENLAKELAKRTRFLRDEVIEKELEEEEQGKGKIFGYYTAFKQYLVANLSPKDFADIYSQTITYGLFAARTRVNSPLLGRGVGGEDFNRLIAYDLIPPTIGILRDVFEFVSRGKLPLQMEVIVDDIAEVLQVADVNAILHQYYKAGKGEDPIVHFYETFLDVYDPATRERRGVYYTPEPVVKYIVRAIHSLLQTHFDLRDGLASKEVTLLDPAGGTLTFPAEAIKLAVEEYKQKYGEGGLQSFIRTHILQHYHAFELMMAPYAIGHIKISFLLEELGYKLKEDDRFKLYLTNTLDMEDLAQTQIPGLESLSEESHKAGRVKQKEPILVILGNPPYSGISANINDWTEELLKTNIDGAQSYYEVDGKPLGEKKLWLQDDYVKFLRFAQWKIHKAGYGIVAMITNHGYLDNPTFRGMRQSLMKTYNEIYIIDLHGNANKKETSPDGSKDENVFDIRQGTAVAVFVKKKGAKGCKVYHRDFYGLRELKYDWLEKREFKTRDYETLKPQTPWYFFIERNTKAIEHYNDWLSINEIFPVNVTGIVTARDGFAIAFDKETLEARIRQFRNLKFDEEFLRSAYELKDTRGWKLPGARKKLANDKNWEDYFQKILYRPFDVREIYYSVNTIDWGRPDLMYHMLKENISLCFVRQYSGNENYSHVLASEYMVDNRTFFSSKGIIQQAPLYIYSGDEDKKKKHGSQTMLLLEPEVEYGKDGKRPNIAAKVFEQLWAAYSPLLRRGAGGEVTPEEIFNYVYGVLYSNVYREKYAEFLKIDFPRIPFTNSYKLFTQMAELGEELVQLHLLKHKVLNKPVAKYKGKGEDLIEKPSYDSERKAVFLSPPFVSSRLREGGRGVKWFEGISEEVWNYHIGGYQVMEKYLKDRKGRLMDNPEHYCQMATAIALTIELQEKIDVVFKKVEELL